MDLKQQVVNTQKEIIAKLAECEEAIARLYNFYGQTPSSLQSFWRELAGKEKAHASLLNSMTRQLDKGLLFHNIGRFDKKSIDAFLTMINDAMKEAEADPANTATQIEKALAIESSLLDAHFYDIVKSDAAEFKLIADRLSTDTHSHVKAVREKLTEFMQGNR